MARAPKVPAKPPVSASGKRVTLRGIARQAVNDQKKQMREPAVRVPTLDSFQNFLTNVGIGTNNLTSGNTYGYNPITLNRPLLDYMYRGSWICQMAVDLVAEDMTREGINIGSQLKPEQTEDIAQELELNGVWSSLTDAIKWSRLYGGALAVITIDGQDPALPLDPAKIEPGSFRGLQVLDRWMVNPKLEQLVSEAGPNYGLPRFYDVVAQALPYIGHAKVHHSRCFRLEGITMPYWQKLALNLWGTSVLEPIYDRLGAFDSTTQGIAQLVNRAHLRTLSVEQLREIIAAGGPAFNALVQNMQMIRLFQSNEGLTLIDAKDKFEAHSYAFSGLSDVLLQMAQQLSGATQIPMVRLYGQSPAGLNSTGESDLRNYYDGVKQKQQRLLRLPLLTTLMVAARSRGIELPRDFKYSFTSLWQLSAKEKSEVGEIRTRTAISAREAALVSDQTVLKELKQQSEETGAWSNITDEDINKADAEPVDPQEMAQLAAGGEGAPGGEQPPAGERPNEEK